MSIPTVFIDGPDNEDWPKKDNVAHYEDLLAHQQAEQLHRKEMEEPYPPPDAEMPS